MSSTKETEQNYIPKFLEALNELVNFYTTTSINPEKNGNTDTPSLGFASLAAITFIKAVKALVDQIVTCIDDIDTKELYKLPGVGKSTLDLLREFITSGKIAILDAFKAHHFWETAQTDLMLAIRELPKYYPGSKLSLDDHGRLRLNGYLSLVSESFHPTMIYVGLQDRGLPFTFEYKGHSFEIDGLYDIEQSYGGFVNFTGTIKSVEKLKGKRLSRNPNEEHPELSFQYDHFKNGFGNRQEFDHFSCPMIDDKGAFTDDDNNNDDENWYQVVKDAVNVAFMEMVKENLSL